MIDYKKEAYDMINLLVLVNNTKTDYNISISKDKDLIDRLVNYLYERMSYYHEIRDTSSIINDLDYISKELDSYRESKKNE